MAKAFKCDRCGCLYEKKETSKQLVIRGYRKPYQQTKDICVKCMTSFEKWWQDGN